MLSWLGLRSRLVLLVLLALLPVFGLFAYSAAKNQRAAVIQAQANLQSEALLAAANQQHLIDRVAQLLGSIASAPSIKERHYPMCMQYLKNLQSQDSSYANLGLVGLDGKIFCRALGSDVDGYGNDRPYFKQVLATQKFSVGEYGTGISGQPGIAFSIPVYSSGGIFNGVAFAAVKITAVQEALSAGKLLDGAQLRVLDRRGVVLAAYPSSAGLAGTPEQDPLVLQAAQARQPGGREAVDSGGVERVYAYAPVSGAANGEVFVAISVPREVITVGPRGLLQGDLAALLGLTAFGIVCAWAMGKRLVVNPANTILKEANELARGNLEARVRLGRRNQDEMGQIGLAFNRMAESLQAQRSELDAALRHADKERVLLDLILNSMSDGVIAVDTEGRFLRVNASAGKHYGSVLQAGVSLEDWRLNHELLLLDGKTPYPLSDRPLVQALRGISIDSREMLLRRPGVEDRILRMSARPLYDTNQQLIGGIAVFNDITELKAAEIFAVGQEQVLILIARSAPLHQSLDAIVSLIEKSSSGSLCSILLVEGEQLRHGSAPSLPQDFVQAIGALPIAEGGGACGTAAFRKQSVVVEDVEHDLLTQDYRELLLAHGLHACWSTPVLSSDGEVLATFAIYRQPTGRPQVKDLELIATATRLASLALERARAEAALVAGEARFRELAANTEDVFYSFDSRSNRLLYISPGYEKISGRSCESLYANPLSYVNAVAPEDLALLKSSRQRSRAGETTDIEFRFLLPDGQTRWIREHSYPVMNTAGQIERIVGTSRDITGRKLADLALAATHRALQMLSRSSIAMNRIDDEATLLAEVCRLAVDAGGYRMAWVGYAQDDEAQSIKPVAHAGEESGYLAAIKLCWRDDQPEGQGPAGQAIRSGQPQHSGDISKADNHFYWHEAALQRGYLSAIFLPLNSEQRSFGVLCLYAGEIQQFSSEEVKLLQELADNLAFGIGSLRARLERRRIEEAVRQATVKLGEQASLLDLAHDAIVVRNLDRTLRFWNKGAERLYGWSAQEVLGKTMEDVMYRSPQVLIDVIDQILAADGDWSGEVEQLARDGGAVSVEMRCTVVRDAHGQVNGVMGIETDIRERKRAREEILQLNSSLEERVQRRTAQLEFANQQLETFSYSVSHDLRSPLSAIDGFSNLLEKTADKPGEAPLSERSRHYLARIRAGVGQMGELIDALLSLAQVSRSSLRWESVDLSAQAEALLAGFQELEPGRVTRLQVEKGLLAQGDARLLKQVLDNLLANAWKFTGGQVTTQITVGREKGSAGEMVYFVRDNGAGFDMAYAEKLFGAFQRLHSQTEFAGTGIGLATVERIIARHGGRVWAESALGQGATFYFTLGAARP